MTIDERICSSGVAIVPDLRGTAQCYSDDVPYDKLIITQTPPPGEQVSAGQTIINVVTEDGKGNATICTHYFNVTADNPAPTLICPDPITTWLLVGGYEVPDFTTKVKIRGGCTVYDDLVISQSPAAGTLITNAGTHTITITVEDEHGHEVVCGSTTITLTSPEVVNPVVEPPAPPDPTRVPIYQSNLLAYWRLDDVDFLDDAIGSRDLTNNNSVEQQPSETILVSSCWPSLPGPLFYNGSARFNLANQYLSAAHDSGLNLTGTSFTIRLGIKLIQLNGAVCFFPISKLSGNTLGYGYRIVVCAGPHIQGQLLSPGGNLTTPSGTVSLSMSTWHHIVMTFNNTSGAMKLYTDGVLRDTQTTLGFTMVSSSPEPLSIGPRIFGSQVEANIDEVGMWSEEWDADRVMDDYQLINCMF